LQTGHARMSVNRSLTSAFLPFPPARCDRLDEGRCAGRRPLADRLSTYPASLQPTPLHFTASFSVSRTGLPRPAPASAGVKPRMVRERPRLDPEPVLAQHREESLGIADRGRGDDLAPAKSDSGRRDRRGTRPPRPARGACESRLRGRSRSVHDHRVDLLEPARGSRSGRPAAAACCRGRACRPPLRSRHRARVHSAGDRRRRRSRRNRARAAHGVSPARRDGDR
jgi:hypothetical protein